MPELTCTEMAVGALVEVTLVSDRLIVDFDDRARGSYRKTEVAMTAPVWVSVDPSPVAVEKGIRRSAAHAPTVAVPAQVAGVAVAWRRRRRRMRRRSRSEAPPHTPWSMR